MSKSVPQKLENFICYCLAGVQIMGDARAHLVRFTQDSKNFNILLHCRIFRLVGSLHRIFKGWHVNEPDRTPTRWRDLPVILRLRVKTRNLDWNNRNYSNFSYLCWPVQYTIVRRMDWRKLKPTSGKFTRNVGLIVRLLSSVTTSFVTHRSNRNFNTPPLPS